MNRTLVALVVVMGFVVPQGGAKSEESRPWTLRFDKATLEGVLAPYEHILGQPIEVDPSAKAQSRGARFTFAAPGTVSTGEARDLLTKALAAHGLMLTGSKPLKVVSAPASEGQPATAPSANAVGVAPARAIATQVVPYELGKTDFQGGDTITVTSVKGDRTRFEPGGTFVVEGTYTLASRDEAALAAYVTNGEVEGDNKKHLTKGSGTFSLVFKVTKKGYPHVSFYPVPYGHGCGGVYFGKGDTLYVRK